VHDDFKDFDVIVPRRLGQRSKASNGDSDSPNGLEGITLSTADRASKSKRRTKTEVMGTSKTDKRINATGEDHRSQKHAVSRSSQGRLIRSGEIAASASTNHSLKQAARHLHPRTAEEWRKSKVESGSDDARELWPEDELHINQNVERFAFGEDTPLSSFSDDRTVEYKQEGEAKTPLVNLEEPISEQASRALQNKNTSDQPIALQSSTSSEEVDAGTPSKMRVPENSKATTGLLQRTEKDTILDDTNKEDRGPDSNEETPFETLKEAETAFTLDEPISVQTALQEGILKDEIHILGTGAIGKFLAHSLAGLSHPPKITLLMQTPLSMQQWHDEGESITLYKQGRLKTHRGIAIESAAVIHKTHPKQWGASFGQNFQHSVQNPSTIIDTLIVTTPAKVTVPAVLAVRDRLRPTSTLCLIHDGLGVIEDLNAIVFPDPERRPTYILGTLTGSTNLAPRSERQFMVEQKGDVALSCSKQPQRAVSTTESGLTISRTDFSWKLTASYLMESLARTPEFNTVALAHKSFMRNQLYRVLAHAVIGPVSVLYDCNYIDLLQSHHAKLTMRGLIEELSRVVLAFPEMQSLRDIEKTLSPQRLEVMIRRVLGNNHQALSTMLQNIRAGKRTDIDYYNGYLLLRAAELGIECPRNEMLINVVKGKQSIVSKQRDRVIPLVEEQQ